MWLLMIIDENMDSYNMYLFVIPGNGPVVGTISSSQKVSGFNPAFGGGGISGFPDTVQ